MLQISQTENPMCSATIDQIRLRRATTLPLLFQNVSSSGFQSEIQVGLSWLIGKFPFTMCARFAYEWPSVWCHLGSRAKGMGARSGEAPVWRCHNSDDWFSRYGCDGVSSNHSSFVPS